METKRPTMTAKRKRPLILLACLLFFAFALLILQFYKIQILEGDKWQKKARAQHEIIVKEPCKRGAFFSNTSVKEGHPEKKVPFVVDLQRFHLYADPESIPQEYRQEIAVTVYQTLLPQDPFPHFAENFEKKSRSRKLAMWLSQDAKDDLLAWWAPYARTRKIPSNALFFVSDYQRTYPLGCTLGPILHTIRENKDEVTQVGVPTGGLEASLNAYVKGQVGKRRMLRSLRNPLEVGEILVTPENGANVYLSINHHLQAFAEEELANGIEKANAKGGWALMMDPHTGEILAWAQYPFFDPRYYKEYFNDPELQRYTVLNALQDAYEPGSVMKPLTAAIALLANTELAARGEPPLFSPEEKIETGNTQFPGRSKPIKDGRHHRYLNLDLAIQKSSNVYVARIIQRVIERLGDAWYRNALTHALGFGERTGIELFGESPGRIPEPGRLHPNGTLEWSTSTPYVIAFGHSILITSLQLVRAYCILANGGYLVTPTLVRKIAKPLPDGTEEVLLDNTSQQRLDSFPKVLATEYADRIVQAMKYVTKIGGTARRADIPGFTEAGKSGTAEKVVNGTYSKQKYLSTFIGLAPAKDARFVLAVVLDEPEAVFIPGEGKNHHGGTSAAPIFQKIASRTLEYLGIRPDAPYSYPPGDPRRDIQKADWINETRMLKELYDQWNAP